jgi:hypothetical protein
MDKQIKLPAKFTQLNEFQANSLLYATREAMQLRKNNKVNTRNIEGKCNLVFTFNFTDAGHVSVDWSEK